MNKIVVVDYGMGNLRSVAQALMHVAPEADVRISGEPDVIRAADRLVLPGARRHAGLYAILARLGRT